MTNRHVEHLKFLCIAVAFSLGACGGGSDSLAPSPTPASPMPVVVVPAIPEAKSTLTFRLLNTQSRAAGRSPLENNPYNGFSFSANDNRVEVRSPAIQAASTYAGLLSAIEVAINALKLTNPTLANVRVTLGSNFTVVDPLSERMVVGQEFLVADFGGAALPINTRVGWLLASDAVTSGNNFYLNISGEIPAGK